jgi:DNA-binding SARP family transcriptional activator
VRKVKSLVKLMALAPHHRLHREHVIDRLWPDKGSEDGANNLHKALYMAGRILEPDLPPRLVLPAVAPGHAPAGGARWAVDRRRGVPGRGA